MVRSMLAGDTDYSSQTIQEIVTDLEAWVQSLRTTSDRLKKMCGELRQSGYWNKVYPGFQDLVLHCIAVYDRSENEIKEVVSEMSKELQQNHIARLQRIGTTAIQMNHQLGQAWHREYPPRLMEYENPEFRKVQLLYNKARDMAAGLLDLTNLATRLQDFVGKKKTDDASTLDLNDVIDLKPNFLGFGLNINALFRKLCKKR